MLHGGALLLLVIAAAKTPRVERVRLPGTAAGKHLLLSYSLGGQQSAASAAPAKSVAAIATQAVLPKKVVPAP